MTLRVLKIQIVIEKSHPNTHTNISTNEYNSFHLFILVTAIAVFLLSKALFCLQCLYSNVWRFCFLLPGGDGVCFHGIYISRHATRCILKRVQEIQHNYDKQQPTNKVKKSIKRNRLFFKHFDLFAKIHILIGCSFLTYYMCLCTSDIYSMCMC